MYENAYFLGSDVKAKGKILFTAMYI